MDFNDMYPIGKLNRTRNKLRSFWSGRYKTVFSSYPSEYEYRQIADMQVMADKAVMNLQSGLDLPGHNIPRLAVDFGTVSTAAYWGGRVYRPDGGCVWIDPIIYATADVSKMKAIASNLGDNQKMLDFYNIVKRKLNTDSLPCTTFDIQGPLNTLSLMWEQQDFMMAMYDYPDTVHEALDLVTTHLIEVIKTSHNMNPSIESPLWPYIWLPKDIGIGITEDYMPLLSPELYKNFGLPYVRRFADEFGGLFIHCCGQFSHHIDNLVNSGINIIGMEFVYPNLDIERLFKTFGDSAVFVPNIMDKCIPEFGSMTNYFKYVHSLRTPDTRLWYILRPDLDDFNNQVEFLESITDAV